MKRHRKFNYIAFTILHDYLYTFFFKSLLILSMVILTTPVYQGCAKYVHPMDSDFTEADSGPSVKLAVHQAQQEEICSIDAFVFNDDILKKIDSYQRTEVFSGGDIIIGSCSGQKVILLCANAPWDAIGWDDVSSFNKALSLTSDLEKEDRNRPVMSAIAHTKAGERDSIKFERLTSEIELRSIRCDFTGKPYAGEKICNARIYLTNVNGTCSMMPTDGAPMQRIINHGGLIPDDIEPFIEPKNIMDSIGNIDITQEYPGIRFLCYPNSSIQESISTPFTRLVLEGDVQGDTWYWPIDINRDCNNSHEGINRNMKYVYDLTIRSKGTKDPDIPIDPEMVETKFVIEKWEEKESYHVSF